MANETRFSLSTELCNLSGWDEKFGKNVSKENYKLRELLPSDWRYLSGHFRQSDRRCSLTVIPSRMIANNR